ncbi:D-alanyl-D-alanine carboxypeptidase/D-alanyl-D-alanine-endopeptidase [Solibacillus sp. FSL R7-0682]|uniref:D-alanyl-D-alanine carboxypeptidase/D-alanyl-D-alanine endopeptidase n=1 Tax=Solibacillus sp. FSL R7-0682 TaxID=2921690 RepID=UPI0030F9D1EE
MEKISDMAPALNDESLAAIDEAVETILGGDKATLTIRDRATGTILYTYRGDHLMRPASNMKILSGAATLAKLGEKYRFKTQLFMDGTLNHGVLNGNVYVLGQGDPTISEADLTHFAKVLKERGIEKIDGQLVGDDSYFPGDTLPPGVDEEGETHYYGARVSAITMSPNSDFDASTIIVTAIPKNVGEKPTYNVIPDLCGMHITNEAITVASGEENTLEVRRRNGTNQIVILGNLPQEENAKVWVSMQNPTKNTLQLWKGICEREGIEFLQDEVVAAGIVPQKAQLIYTHNSCTVGEIFSIFMKLSNNSIADIFTKTMGKLQYGVGDYETGIRVIKAYLDEQQIEIEDWRFVDGSGLSHGIRLSSNGISKLLFELQKEAYFNIFFDSLPVAGNTDRLIGGTLKDRFLESEYENRIFAKTGYIHEVNTLSGYLIGNSGKQYIFSVMLEGREEGIPFLDSGLKKIIATL